jgi:hypothetical protein
MINWLYSMTDQDAKHKKKALNVICEFHTSNLRENGLVYL